MPRIVCPGPQPMRLALIIDLTLIAKGAVLPAARQPEGKGQRDAVVEVTRFTRRTDAEEQRRFLCGILENNSQD